MYWGGGSLYFWQKSCRLLLKETKDASPGPGTVKQAAMKINEGNNIYKYIKYSQYSALECLDNNGNCF